jgi:signal peptide peptidase SppA
VIAGLERIVLMVLMSITYEHLRSQLFNRPLLVDPDRIAIMVDVLAGRTGIAFDPDLLAEANGRIDQLPAEARRVMRGPAKSKRNGSQGPYQVVDQTAIIPVHGTLVNRGAWIGASSGLTSYEGLRHQVRSAMTDDDVHSVVLDIDSPGGQAAGAFELAGAISELAAKKPVIAVINDTAASAAYAIASAASKIMITESGVAGSIGVVLVHFDQSRRLDQAGVKPTLIHAGARKVDGNPYQPLPEGVKENLQAEVSRYYDMFVVTVAKGRPNLTAAAIRATEAAVYIGQAAIDAGLVDETGDLEKALAELKAAKAEPAPTGLLGARPAEPLAGPTPASAPAMDYALLGSILALPEATGRNEQARHLAEQGVSIDVAQAVLRSFPTDAERAAERATQLVARQAEVAAREASAKKAASEAAARQREDTIRASWSEVADDIGRKMRF